MDLMKSFSLSMNDFLDDYVQEQLALALITTDKEVVDQELKRGK